MQTLIYGLLQAPDFAVVAQVTALMLLFLGLWHLNKKTYQRTSGLIISRLGTMPLSRLNRPDLFLTVAVTTYAVTHGHGFVALALVAITTLGLLIKMKLTGA